VAASPALRCVRGGRADPGARTVGVRPAQAQSLRGFEAVDIADLGDHEHRRVSPDAADLCEDPDALVVVGESLDLARGLVDLAVKI
jgi:hypothetical protein